MNKNKLVHISVICIFVSLYLLVATISMINSVDFFNMSHNGILSWSLAVGFELGAAASLAAIIILDKTNKSMVWFLFLLLTAFQMMANSYHAFINLDNYVGWIELFGLEGEEPIIQKRILSITSGAVLPLVALGFIKSLTDYIRPNTEIETQKNEKNENFKDNKEPEETGETGDTEEIKEPKELIHIEPNSTIITPEWNSTITDELNDLDEENFNKAESNNKFTEEINEKSEKTLLKNKEKKTDTTVKAKAQGKTPSSAKDFNRADGMPLKGRRRTGDYI